MTCAIPIETFVRENIAKDLLSKYFLRRGFKVITGNYIDVFEYSLVEHVDFIIINNVDSNSFNSKYLKGFSEKGIGIILFQNEGLIAPEYDDIVTRMRTPLLNFVDEYWAWGKGIHSYFMKNLSFNGISRVVGHPMFEVAKQSRFVPSMSEPKLGEYILVNTNFSLINEAVDGQYINESNKERRLHMGLVRESILNLVRKLSESFPTLKIVIRPHPSESIDFYKNETQDLSNVHVIYENRAIDWIYYSKCLIHNGCTTAIEGSLLGKPVVSYVEVMNAKFDIKISDDAGVRIASPKDVVNFINNLSLNSKYIAPILSNEIENYSKNIESILDGIPFNYTSSIVTKKRNIAFIVRNYIRYNWPLFLLLKSKRNDYEYRRRKYSRKSHKMLINQFNDFTVESVWGFVNLISVKNE